VLRQCVAPYADHADLNFGGPHDLAAAERDINGGQMNGFIRGFSRIREVRRCDRSHVRDPRPDVRENASILGDLRSDFDFSQLPRRPMILPVKPHTTLISAGR
jgi:hypothetical protein